MIKVYVLKSIGNFDIVCIPSTLTCKNCSKRFVFTFWGLSYAKAFELNNNQRETHHLCCECMSRQYEEREEIIREIELYNKDSSFTLLLLEEEI